MSRILVVDDNADNRKLLVWVLEDQGYACQEAETAEEAIRLLESKLFDLVLMDVGLPGMQGDEATRVLKAREEFRSLPILAVTAHAIRGQEEKLRAVGFDAILFKPIDEDALVAAVERHVVKS